MREPDDVDVDAKFLSLNRTEQPRARLVLLASPFPPRTWPNMVLYVLKMLSWVTTGSGLALSPDNVADKRRPGPLLQSDRFRTDVLYLEETKRPGPGRGTSAIMTGWRALRVAARLSNVRRSNRV